MKFDMILQYQAVDQELIGLENELAKCKELNQLYVAKSKIDEATQSVSKLTAEANELMNNFTKLQVRIGGLKNKLDEFDGICEGIADVQEADYYVKQIDSLLDEISSLEKSASRDSMHIDGVCAEYKKTWEAGILASENYKHCMEEFESVKAKIQPRAKEIQSRLNELEKDIPPQLLSKYKELRNAKKMPAFVEYDPSKNTCGRCYMELPNDAKGKLKNSGDFSECPNCRRILYMA